MKLELASPENGKHTDGDMWPVPCTALARAAHFLPTSLLQRRITLARIFSKYFLQVIHSCMSSRARSQQHHVAADSLLAGHRHTDRRERAPQGSVVCFQTHPSNTDELHRLFVEPACSQDNIQNGLRPVAASRAPSAPSSWIRSLACRNSSNAIKRLLFSSRMLRWAS